MAGLCTQIVANLLGAPILQGGLRLRMLAGLVLLAGAFSVSAVMSAIDRDAPDASRWGSALLAVIVLAVLERRRHRHAVDPVQPT